MGSIVLAVAALVVVGLVLGGWLVLASSNRVQDALERDEREISRGRDVGAR
jgi:hypothetical protein